MSLPTEPGLELDRLIADKVLGWYQDSDIGGPRAWWFKKGKEADAMHLNYFSTDIKAAWDLAEKFELSVTPWIKAWRIYRDGKFLPTPWEGHGWTAYNRGEFLGDGPKNAAPTAPHAICLAALMYCEK